MFLLLIIIILNTYCNLRLNQKDYSNRIITLRNFEMPIANINGNKINYVDTEGNNPVIIFSHVFFNLSCFDSQLENLKHK